MNILDWPPGHRTFEEDGFFMQFDECADGGSMPAILFLKREGDHIEILDIQAFKSDQAALKWFARKRLYNSILQSAGNWLH